MILQLLGRKIINISTPYKRIFISVEDEYNSGTYVLPGIKSATFFLNNSDLICINTIDELENLCYIDYDIINEKDKIYQKYYEDFIKFKELVKQELMKGKIFKMEVSKKIIFSEVLHISCTIKN